MKMALRGYSIGQEGVMNEGRYERTMYACFIGYIVQAIVNNFVTLLFLTFEKSYHIPLGKISKPLNASGKSSGRNTRPNIPAAANTWARIIDTLYPILSTNPADNRSTNSWIPKLIVISIVIFPSGI